MSRDLILLALSLFTWGLGEGMFFSFQPIYLQQLGADPKQIGFILGGVGLAMTVVHLPTGYIADRFGRRPLLYASWVLGAIAAWVMALANTLPFFVTGAVIYGFTVFAVVPLNSYITAARGNWSVGRTLTLISSAFNLGGILGPLAGGWIGQNFGLQRTFLVAAILFMASAMIVFGVRAQPVENDGTTNGLRAVWNGRFSRYLVIIFAVTLALYLPQPLSQNFLRFERGIDLVRIGQLVSISGLGVVTFNLILGHLNARIGFVLAQIAVAGFCFLLWRTQVLPWYFVAYFLLGAYRTARSLGIAQARALVPQSHIGIAYGLIETAASIAIILAPLIAGQLFAVNPLLMYTTSLVLIVLAIFLTIVFTPLHRKEVL